MRTFTELRSNVEITEAFPLMSVLRERIRPETFLAEVRRQQGQGYELVGAFEDGTLVALAGIRRAHTLSRGEHMFVDDLVTDEPARGKGHAAALLRWVAARAAAEGIQRLVPRQPGDGKGVLRAGRLHVSDVDSVLGGHS